MMLRTADLRCTGHELTDCGTERSFVLSYAMTAVSPLLPVTEARGPLGDTVTKGVFC